MREGGVGDTVHAIQTPWVPVPQLRDVKSCEQTARRPRGFKAQPACRERERESCLTFMLAVAPLPARPRVNSATATRLHDLRRHPLARARDGAGRAAKRAAQQRLQHRQAHSSPTTAASCTLSTLPVSAVLKHHLTVLSALGEPATQLVQMLQLALASGWCASGTTVLTALRPRRAA